MISQAVSAWAYVLKGDPPTLIAGLLIWMGRQELQSRACREVQVHRYSRYDYERKVTFVGAPYLQLLCRGTNATEVQGHFTLNGGSKFAVT